VLTGNKPSIAQQKIVRGKGQTGISLQSIYAFTKIKDKTLNYSLIENDSLNCITKLRVERIYYSTAIIMFDNNNVNTLQLKY